MVSTMADDALRALAHPLRRDIVERLSGVATFGEVTRDGVSKPTILEVFDALTCAEVMQRWFHAC
jgi:DNA-binding transcriptional ArsR family regulator